MKLVVHLKIHNVYIIMNLSCFFLSMKHSCTMKITIFLKGLEI